MKQELDTVAPVYNLSALKAEAGRLMQIQGLAYGASSGPARAV